MLSCLCVLGLKINDSPVADFFFFHQMVSIRSFLSGLFFKNLLDGGKKVFEIKKQ